jgi:hypothetical protein
VKPPFWGRIERPFCESLVPNTDAQKGGRYENDHRTLPLGLTTHDDRRTYRAAAHPNLFGPDSEADRLLRHFTARRESLGR